MQVQLGTEVRDTLTGFKGIAVSRTEYLYGCVRIGVQPKGKPDQAPEPKYFDEPSLEVVGKGIANVDLRSHGPRPAPQRQGDPTR